MFQVHVESVRREGDYTYTVVKAENHSSCKVDRIMFECTYFNDKGTAVKMANGRVRQLEPGQSGHDEVPASGKDLTSVTCRATTVVGPRG
ncbi:MAG: hypothetical protein E5Y73_09740 [Mesorhizobium sp.]|uniref:hypothetical protein n=1 Tax=Mesorhizobium sp. TaxID=1871066 RepID=UPI0012149FF1|nr:hypothetical protein [Mesorhizobium sp.]TIL94806.1 MAG: hypothetical protein E5Y73_09740 [Mesorhizobium sp.]